MKDLEKAYSDTINEDLKEIKLILSKDVEIEQPGVLNEFSKILSGTSKNITSKWSAGKKHLRTSMVKKNFPGYPKGVLTVSILIDSMINILDDLLDEEMDKESKAMLIVEIIRVLGSYHYQKLDDASKKAIGDYFNKIIVVAVTENMYRGMITNETDKEKISAYSIKAYYSRSLDMDIFIELPLISKYGKEYDKETVRLARILRVMTLIGKDIDDIDHDRKNGIGTVTVMLDDKGIMKEILGRIIKYFKNEANDIEIKGKDSSIKKNMKSAIWEEESSIEKRISL